MILASVIAVGMMSGFTLTAGAAGAGPDGNSGTAVTSETTVWNDGRYVVNGNVTISGDVTVSGDVHLILTDGSSLIVTGDVSFGEGVSLTVYGQAQGTGTLTVSGGMANGIDGNNSNGGNAGSVTFNGGTVEVSGSIACGGTGGTGRGTGYDGGRGGSVTVNGGSVTVGGSIACGGTGADGNPDAGGFGRYSLPRGGNGGNAGSVTVNGGTLEVIGCIANGGTGGNGNTANEALQAGSGYEGGVAGNGGSVTVTGGSVTVTDSIACGGTGGNGGEGLSTGSGGNGGYGGNGGNGSTVTVSGGTVTVGGNMSVGGNGGNAGYSGFSKGASGGNGGNGSVVIINGGTVTVDGSMASGGSGASGGNAKYSNGTSGGDGGNGGDGGTVTVSGGTATVNGSLADRGNRGGRGSGGSGGYSRGKYGSYGDYGTVTGIIYKNNVGTVYGDVTLENDIEIPEDATLIVPEGASLTVPKGVILTIPQGTSLTVNGTLDLGGTVTNNGTLILQTGNSLIGDGTVNASENAINRILTFTADDIIVPEDLVYNGNDLTDTVEQTIRLKQKIICGVTFTYDTAAWTYSFSKDGAPVTEIKDAGEYTVIYANDSASVEKAFYVAKAGFQVSSEALSNSISKDIYWGDTTFEFSIEIKTPENITIHISGLNATIKTEGVLGNAEFDVDSSSAVISGEGAENYSVTVANTANGYVKVIPLTITGVKMDADTYTYGDTVNYDNAALEIEQPGGTEAKAEDLVFIYTGAANDNSAWNSTTAPTKAGEYTLTVSHEDTLHYSGKQEIRFTIHKVEIEEPTQAAPVTYNGAEQTYGVVSTADYTVMGGVQKNANEAGYDVTVSLTDKFNTNWDNGTTDDLTHKFIISKKEITVTADDKEAYSGNRRPKLTYKVDGLIGKDKLIAEPTLVTDADMNRVGTYTITASGADAGGNYSISYVDGTLNVKMFLIPTAILKSDVDIADDITGGEVNASEKRAGKDDIITITVTPDAEYELTELSVTDSRGNVIDVIKVSDTVYTLKMPGYDVTINAEFAKIEAPAPADPTADCSRDHACPMYPFADLDRAEWYHDGVHYAIEEGLMNGMGDGIFAPNGTTTRAMIVTILWRLEGAHVVNYLIQFEDVEAEMWYTEAIRWAASEGIVNGYSDTAFGPDDAITREQLATILYRYADYKSYDLGTSADLSCYIDADKVSDWALGALKWANGEEIVNGLPGDILAPQGNATRAQAATMIFRFLSKVK